MNPFHAHAVTVPGAVRGWHDLLERHGSMTLADVLSDAVYYAGEGFPTAPIFGLRWEKAEGFLRNAVNAEDYLPQGKAPKPGQVVRLPGLANTLRAIAEGGPDAFYSGPTADAIVSSIQEQGGLMTHEDLQNHHSTWGEPISADYHGVTVYECPPNGQGLTALLALNIAANFDLKSLAWDSPRRLHLMVESMRLAWADAHQYIADMSQAPAPLDTLLSKEYAQKRAQLISAEATMNPPPTFGDDSAGFRYHLFERRRWRWQCLFLYQEPVHGFWRRHCRQRNGCLAAKPRRWLHASSRPCQQLGAGQTSLSHHYPWPGAAVRRTVGEFWGYGRVYAAAGSFSGHKRPG